MHQSHLVAEQNVGLCADNDAAAFHKARVSIAFDQVQDAIAVDGHLFEFEFLFLAALADRRRQILNLFALNDQQEFPVNQQPDVTGAQGFELCQSLSACASPGCASRWTIPTFQ